MSLKRTAAIIALVAVLATGILMPEPAHADNTALIVVASVVAYVVVVVTAAWLIYRAPSTTDTAPLLPTTHDAPLAQDRSPEAVHFGRHCAQDTGGLTLACW
jgi:ABC-type nickel/cobalt efflux system permease component RcnA